MSGNEVVKNGNKSEIPNYPYVRDMTSFTILRPYLTLDGSYELSIQQT